MSQVEPFKQPIASLMFVGVSHRQSPPVKLNGMLGLEGMRERHKNLGSQSRSKVAVGQKSPPSGRKQEREDEKERVERKKHSQKEGMGRKEKREKV